ncbi:DUF4249 family protein [Neolewinella aurantiaca]|nr:DUF4249 family protein [Neolewinella aurantiaca]
MQLRFTLLVLTALALAGCRDDFSLEADYQDVPVAYAYLNPDDSRHFIRVEKAFLEAGGNAEAVAGIADSIYYGAEDVTVILENVTQNTSREMERVNAQDYGLERTDGIFAQSPNIAYSLTDQELPLFGGNTVRLTIQRPGEEDAVAETNLIPAIEISRPGEMVRVDDYPRPVAVVWSKEEEAAIYDITIFFTIRELYPSDPDRNRTVQLEWPVVSGFVPGPEQSSSNLVSYDIQSESFFQFIGSALEEEAGVTRRFQFFDIQVAAAGQEVLDRRTLENANAGITSSQSLPRYSNLIGGLGLVTSSTSALKEGIQFDNGSLDSLEAGIYTRDLGFR